MGGKEEHTGPDLAGWQHLASAILWIEVMWRHAGEREERMKALGMPRPRFQEDEMGNLVAYLRAVSDSLGSIQRSP